MVVWRRFVEAARLAAEHTATVPSFSSRPAVNNRSSLVTETLLPRQMVVQNSRGLPLGACLGPAVTGEASRWGDVTLQGLRTQQLEGMRLSRSFHIIAIFLWLGIVE